jgi:copper oxidase (laccase) domain-containing protein
MLYVTVADCVPVYLVHPDTRAVALLHAGWRGVAGRILDRGIEVFSHKIGAAVGDIVMHCGVAICGTCYEVGSEVMEGVGLPAHGPGPHYADLRLVLGRQAEQLGVRHITTSAWCSAHDRDRFFSHRASRGADGRMVAYLGISRP